MSRVGDLNGVMSNAQYFPMNEYVKPPGRNILQENYGQVTCIIEIVIVYCRFIISYNYYK